MIVVVISFLPTIFPKKKDNGYLYVVYKDVEDIEPYYTSDEQILHFRL